MTTRKLTGLLISPILGTLPIVAYLLVDCFFDYRAAFVTGFTLLLFLSVLIYFYLRVRIPYTLILSVYIFIPFALLFSIGSFRNIFEPYPSIVFELLLLLAFSLFFFTRGYYRGKISSGGGTTSEKEKRLVCFDFDLFVIRTALFVIGTHLLVVLVYQVIPQEIRTSSRSRFVYFYLLFIFIATHFLYEFFHLFLVRKKIKKERWLPVVDTNGGVKGRIAASVSEKMGNRHLHPVVRVALIYKGRLFLRKRDHLFSGWEGALDYPYETDVLYKETLDEAVKRSFRENGGSDALPTRFLLKYIYKDEHINRLVYLYSCNLTQPDQLCGLELNPGKWWMGKQVEENLGTGLFSGYFEKEYEFLNSTVLMTDRFLNDLAADS